MAKEFDLIPANKLCDMFRVEFDLYTPRAYLSILARDESIKTYYELDDEAKPKVVESALSIVTGYNLQKSAILSDMQSRSRKNQGIISIIISNKALEAMIDYASQKSLTEINARGGENGCHVCLVLDGKSHGFPLDEESQILAGFIQVSGLKFYRDLCPNDKKDQ